MKRPERRALQQLTQNPNIIIKPADKGSKIVIMDRQQYLLEAKRQLSNTTHYKPIPVDRQIQTQSLLRNIIQSLFNKKIITHKQKTYLFGPDHPRPRLFYLLPKIHKDPSRPYPMKFLPADQYFLTATAFHTTSPNTLNISSDPFPINIQAT